MGKRKNPPTSLEAYHRLDPVRLSQTQQDIVRAVKALGEANFEAVASFLMVKPEKIWKRMGECEKAGAIYKPGNTVLTKNGYKSYTYRINQAGESTEPVTEKALPGKSVSDYSKKLIPQQANLFNL
jgi:hypothetical protein